MAQLSEADFAAAVKEVAADMWKVKDASTHGFVAVVKFASRSGKYLTEARLTFDPLTGRFVECVFPYTTANQPRFFMQALERLAAGR